ncbi:MAG: T9SS type A sorting domain-containing protein [Bacteroidetes bacterium]|nr:T9SS type A sorting domain-containing protein [Bacteroidota bacterium]
MKKLLFYFVFFFISINTTVCQTTYFNNIYIFNNIHLTSGQSIILSDSIYNVAASAIDTTGLLKILLCNTDTSNGNIINKKLIGWGYNNFYLGYSGCFQKTSDNNFVVVGVKHDTVQSTAFLMKVNSNFDTLFFKEYVDTTFKYLEFQQGKETYDKGFILVGTLPGTGTYDQNIVVLKTDSVGNEQWRKIYNWGGVEYARNVIQTPDGGYLLGCYTYNTNYLSGDGIILKLDTFGNIEWSRNVGGPNRDGVPVIALAKDSNYIIATAYAYSTIWGADASELKIQVLKLNKLNGDTIWVRQYDTISTANAVSMVKELDNGNILIMGSAFTENSGIWFGTSWILKLNSNGDSLLYRRFWKYNDEHTNNNTAYDFCVTNEKSIVICGEVKQDTAYNYLWLAKMDSLGCLQPGCDIVGVVEIKADIVELTVYPNPANNSITFNTDMYKDFKLTIFNAIGQTILQKQLATSNTTLNIQSFQQGMYYYTLINNKGKVLSGKFVKE